MPPRVDPVPSDEKLPAQADVVIIGGGIIGTSTALFLAQRGISTVLCEKGHIAGEQSSRNWGWCRKMARDPREIPLIIESLRLWERMNGTVEAETGFRTCGIMYLGETAETLANMEAWLEHAREYQLDTRGIDGAEVGQLLPGSAKRWAGALYNPSDGKAEPQMAAPAIAEGARRRGATIFTGCAVRGIETAAGRGASVVTEKGRIACQSIVLAGRAGAGPFCGNLGGGAPRLRRSRKGPHRLPVDRAGGRRVVAPLLRQSRRRPAAAKGVGLGHAHRALVRRPGNLGDGRPLRLPQADGWRLHGRDVGGSLDRPRPRQLSPAARIPADRAVALEQAALPGRAPFCRRMAEATALGTRRALAVRTFAGARPRSRPGGARTRPRQHRRSFPGL